LGSGFPSNRAVSTRIELLTEHDVDQIRTDDDLYKGTLHTITAQLLLRVILTQAMATDDAMLTFLRAKINIFTTAVSTR